MNRLKVVLAGVEMSNPTMLASGMMGETGMSLVEAARHGAGGVVTKSVGMDPRTGYPNPTLVEANDHYINAMGLPNPGIADYGEEMASAIKAGVPIFASIFAASVSDFAHLAGKMEDYGASVIELNLSCPHAKGYGMEMGIDPEIVGNIVKEVKAISSIPIFAKLTPNTHRLVEAAEAVQRAEGDGIVAINTLKAIAISVEFRRPVLSNIYGGMSGPAVKPVGLRAVYDIYEKVDIPIIGVGGVETWRDAMEYIMAGASAVQVGSAVGRHGLGVFQEISAGMGAYLEDNQANIADMVGVAHVRK
jgi:dihydroorotate dehydrogenase (NAD+) catalytic subunit